MEKIRSLRKSISFNRNSKMKRSFKCNQNFDDMSSVASVLAAQNTCCLMRVVASFDSISSFINIIED